MTNFEKITQDTEALANFLDYITNYCNLGNCAKCPFFKRFGDSCTVQRLECWLNQEAGVEDN